MTYFQDFSALNYHSGPFDSSEWRCPLLAIGWLEYPHEFPHGQSQLVLVERLRQLADDFGDVFPAIAFRGLHECSFCVANGMSGGALPSSHLNLFIPGSGAVFVAPAGISHYIEEHGYAPPSDFVESVLICPAPKSNEYLELMNRANSGFSNPLSQVQTQHRSSGVQQ